MKNYPVHRIITALILGAAFGCYTFYDYSKWAMRGKDAFMLHEAQRFDKYMANPKISFSISLGIVMIAILVAYELMVRVIDPRRTDQTEVL